MQAKPRWSRVVSWLGVVLLWSACATGRPHEVANAPSPTGAVSEEQFKAMHQLRSDAAPARKGQEVELAGTKAYLSLPEGVSGPMPGIIVIHEWWGLNEHVQHWADRLAAEGYAALAVDLYGGKVATTRDEALSLLKAVNPEHALATLQAAQAFLQKEPRIRAPRTGTIGWCFGGGWSLTAAMSLPELTAAVMYYGTPVTDAQQLSRIHARLLALFGTKDASIPPDTVRAFEKALEDAGVQSRILEYDAGHAFANPSDARYDPRAASAAWAETSLFFQRNLKP
ncbi:dienelactone hydrolase family protein [Myxococcaceae bacterium JPH2]|nr:dienelactone hydrolase family protein [Myxococcaceae bacterium JPH2]